jgi:heptosyltransferase-2
VIALHRLGDTVFTIPAISEIQKLYRQKMIVICFPESIPIYNLTLNDIYFCPIDRENFFFGRRIAKIKAKKKLSSLKPKIIFDLTGSMISASLIFSQRAKQIIGINGERFRTIYDKFIAFRKNPHLVDVYLDAISPVIQLTDRNNLKKIPTVFNPKGKILIHPFAGWRAKEWNFNKYYKLAISLKRFYQISLIVPINNISNDITNEFFLDGVEVIQTQTVEQLIEQIKSCSIFIGNDSGPLYIASLLGKPTFSIYGPTNYEFSSPFGESHQNITKTLKCSPEKNKQYCFTTAGMFGCPSFECMNLLEFEDAYDRIIELINKSFNQ